MSLDRWLCDDDPPRGRDLVPALCGAVVKLDGAECRCFRYEGHTEPHFTSYPSSTMPYHWKDEPQ